MAALARIKTLKLVPNPFRDPPEAVAKGGIESIEQYYKNIFAEGFVIERRDVKVVIIGKAGAGKTRCAIVSQAGRGHQDDVPCSVYPCVALCTVGVMRHIPVHRHAYFSAAYCLVHSAHLSM